MNDVYKIVLTGGQCGGKTSILHTLKSKLEVLGYQVLTCPETPSILLNAGLDPTKMHKAEFSEFQRGILHTQLALEHSFLNFAAATLKPTVIIFDRGIMDGKAYCSDELWQEIANEAIDELDAHTLEEQCLQRYDAVIHLQTTAIGAREAYDKNCKNNSARYGDAEFAARTDLKLIDAWSFMEDSHYVVDNSDGKTFVDRVIEVFTILSKVLGRELIQGKETERKWLIREANMKVLKEVVSTAKSITQTYLTDKHGSCRRVRCTNTFVKNGHTTEPDVKYFYTEKRGKGITRSELEFEITRDMHASLLKEEDSQHRTISKTRYGVMWKGKLFEADWLQPLRDPLTNKAYDICLLECELTNENEQVEIPPVFKVIKDVTDDDRYSNYSLSCLNTDLAKLC